MTDTPELVPVVRDSAVAEMSLRITKASYNKSEDNPRRWAAVDSDIDEDLYQERMSIELYQDFDRRIKNNEPVPEAFKDVICEVDWCGGMPYLSIAHYKAGSGLKNVPGSVESVYIDGTRLKSKGTLHDTEMGRRVFDALVDDLYKKKSGDEQHLPVRISIGFLDLEHKHRSQVGGQDVTFTRDNPGKICPLCAQGIGGKIYMKGQLVHLAMTRVPVNPRTAMEVERSMDGIETKRDDAESIIGKDLASELEEKSIASDMLVVRSDEEGTMPKPADMELCDECYDPNVDLYDQECVDRVMAKYVAKPQADATVKSKARFDAVQKAIAKLNPVVEEKMEQKAVETKDTQVAPEPVTEKGVAGIPEKKFEYEGISGDGKNHLPNPVKAQGEDEGDEEGEMDKAFTALKSRIRQAKSRGESGEAVQDINQLFSQLGVAVENEFVPKSVSGNGGLDAGQIAQIVQQAIAPLAVEIQSLKSKLGNDAVSNGGVVKSKALTLSGYPKPEDMIQRSVPQQPQRKLTQIEQIALKSTGAIRGQ